jgi:hypothetical protein
MGVFHTVWIRNLSLIILFVGMGSAVIAQDLFEHLPLRSSGAIPEDFLVSSTEKYLQSTRKLNVEEERKTHFFLESEFLLDELLHSGMVLFNDPVSDYLGKVMDEILKDDPQLRSEIHIYAVKSTGVNAVSTDRGVFLVNLGLLAHLDSEAQLAYILCHELIHYKRQHNLSLYLHSEGPAFKSKTKKNWQRPTYQPLLELNRYSRQIELEADWEALNYYLPTNYDLVAVEEVFNVLAYAHVPYSNKPFDLQFLNKGPVEIPPSLMPVHLNPIQPEEEEGSETHPSLRERRERMVDRLQRHSNINRKTFLVSEEAFHQVRDLARLSLPDLLIYQRNYAEALYHLFLLNERFPAHPYLDQLRAEALYGMAEYKLTDRAHEVLFTPDSLKMQGPVQAVYEIMDKLQATEIATLAVLHCYELVDDPTSIMALRTRDLIEDLVIYGLHQLPESYFFRQMPAGEAYLEQSFSRYAFIDLLQDAQFVNWLDNGWRLKGQPELDVKRKRTHLLPLSQQRKAIQEARKKELKGASLGIDSVVFLNPVYQKVDLRKKIPRQYIESEQRQKVLKEMIQRSGARLDLHTRILDSRHLSSRSSIEEYNDIVVLNEWIDEHLSHEMFMIGSRQEEALAVCREYGTPYFSFTGILTTQRAMDREKVRDVVGPMIFVATAPVGVYNLLQPNIRSLYFSAVFDIENCATLMNYINPMETRDKEAVVETNIYWALLQMKRSEND